MKNQIKKFLYFIFIINILYINFMYTDNINDKNIYLYSQDVIKDFKDNKNAIISYIKTLKKFSDEERVFALDSMNEFLNNIDNLKSKCVYMNNNISKILNSMYYYDKNDLSVKNVLNILNKAYILNKSIEYYSYFLNYGNNKCYVCYDYKKIICRFCKVLDKSCNTCNKKCYYSCGYCSNL